MPLKLHIFEERYKIMVRECIAQDKPFGVLLIKAGREALGALAHPFEVGTLAHIIEVEHLDNGRMNITAVGGERFRVRSLDDKQLYLQGDVEMLPFTDNTATIIDKGTAVLKQLTKLYIGILQQSQNVEVEVTQIPDELSTLIYVGAALLQMDEPQKQDLLEMKSMRLLVGKLIEVFQREIAIMTVLLSPPYEGSGDSPFSVN